MRHEDLTVRQSCILYALLLLHEDGKSVTWSSLEMCFEGAVLPIVETIDAALVSLERQGYVALTRAGQAIITVRLKQKGRRCASEIKLRRVFWRLNVKNIQLLLNRS